MSEFAPLPDESFAYNVLCKINTRTMFASPWQIIWVVRDFAEMIDRAIDTVFVFTKHN